MSPIGHFGVGLAAKRAIPRVPLAILLLATEVLDLLCFAFIFAGVERASEQIQLNYIPWSHSLFMAVVWSVIAGLAAWLFSKDRRISLIVALVVFSHWVMDFIGHDPDLPLLFAGSPLIGLGLQWTHATTGLVIHYTQGLALELGVFILGLIVYWTARRNPHRVSP